MLSSNEAKMILAEYGKDAVWTKHSAAVADTAVRIGAALTGTREIDLGHLWATALLHDVGRCVTHDPVEHGVHGYKLLRELGHHKEAYVCASHILFGLPAADAIRCGLPSHDFVPRTTEERLVPLADYLVEGVRPTTLAERFASLRDRNTEHTFFLGRLNRAYDAANAFMTELEAETGESVEALVAAGDSVRAGDGNNPPQPDNAD